MTRPLWALFVVAQLGIGVATLCHYLRWPREVGRGVFR
jgi:hypothetical protein